MRAKEFESQLRKCRASFVKRIKDLYDIKVNSLDIEIFMSAGYLTFMYEGDDDYCFKQEIEEINGELCNMNLIVY